MKKVLIIEDDKVLRENTVVFLNENGYQAFAAENGEQGVEKAIAILPDIIICDISMPLMDGYTVYEELQAHKDASVIPFIFLTAKAQVEDIKKGLRLGVDDYITKPFTYDELQNSIQLRLDKEERRYKALQEKLSQYIDNPTIGVFIYQHNRFSYVNSKMISMFGYSLQEFQKLDFTKIVHPDDVDKVNHQLDQVISGFQLNINTNFIGIKVNGEKIKAEMMASVCRIKGVFSIVGNIIETGEISNPGVKKYWETKEEKLDELAKGLDRLGRIEIVNNQFLRQYWVSDNSVD